MKKYLHQSGFLGSLRNFGFIHGKNRQGAFMNKSNGICLLQSDNNSMEAKYKEEELVIFH